MMDDCDLREIEREGESETEGKRKREGEIALLSCAVYVHAAAHSK
jgi:hypothetical protein